MADLKENEFPIEGAQYLRGVSGNGSSVRVENKMFTQNMVGTTIDCNEMKEEGRYCSNKWKNAPYIDIAILEIIRYSPDWIVQIFSRIPGNGSLTILVRSFYNGTTWSAWNKII